MKYNLQELSQKVINGLFWICICIVCIACIRLFFFSSFRIPTNSMEPVIISGDHVLVGKLVPGARLFNIFASSKGEQVQIYRLLGIRKTKRNDVIVFNIPYPLGSEQIEMDITQYYIKRCIGLPRDTVRIINGIYTVSGYPESVGNLQAQQNLRAKSTEYMAKDIFPQDSMIHWNLKDFGPLYLPKSGDRIEITDTTYLLYKKIIEWEQHTTFQRKDNEFYLNHQPITSYCFKKDYYFMGGDQVTDSRDSRYWGLLPEEYIVGKALFIWRSTEPYRDEIRWKRFFKRIR